MTQAVSDVTMSLVFFPDPQGYASLANEGNRRAEILLEFMDELLLKTGGTEGWKGEWKDLTLRAEDGRLTAASIVDVAGPLLEAHSTLRSKWLEDQDEAWLKRHAFDPNNLTSSLQVAGLQEFDVYYYGQPFPWCRRTLQLAESYPSGTSALWSFKRPVDPQADLADPETPYLSAEVRLAIQHPPIQPEKQT